VRVGTKGTGFYNGIYCLACEMHGKVTNHEGISGGCIVTQKRLTNQGGVCLINFLEVKVRFQWLSSC